MKELSALGVLSSSATADCSNYQIFRKLLPANDVTLYVSELLPANDVTLYVSELLPANDVTLYVS